MSWFEDQIKQRKDTDDAAFAESFENMAAAITGSKISKSFNDNRENTQAAINVILHYFHIKQQDVPENIRDMNEHLDYQLRPKGIMYRSVKLEKGWYKQASGAMIGVLVEDKRVVALIPKKNSGYKYYDNEKRTYITVNRHNEKLIDPEAYVFYRPFPLKKMTIASLVNYAVSTLSTADYFMLILSMLAVTFVGMFMPRIVNLLLTDVVGSGSIQGLIAASVFFACVIISMAMLTSVRNAACGRVNAKISMNIQSAALMRVISLPASFFMKFSAGDLNQRLFQLNFLCEDFVSVIFATGLSAVFAFIYIFQVAKYTPTLLPLALIFALISLGFIILIPILQMRIKGDQYKFEGEESGMTYSLISGVSKIRLTGSEKRVFARWANQYAKSARLKYNPPGLLKIYGGVFLAITLMATLLIYIKAYRTNVTVANYYTFFSAYGMVTGALATLFNLVPVISEIKPTLERIKPILETEPEVSENKKIVSEITGKIKLNNVYFRYSENEPYVLENLSLSISKGEYVAIVGKTGCGKSTLIRLLLGLEKASRGAVYYDDKDINTLDLKSLRKNIGSVTQNGKLFEGDIYSNIVISAPWLTIDDAWEAAELAGMAEDIRRMPMGMFTYITEGSGGISGGQRQRLMIARAIAPKPKLLIFDEATSALDNITQKKVSDALDSLKCTRIVIAHRLSTIKHCDRILVMDQGRIIEEGSYDELISQKGFFAELVERQRLDENIK